MFIRVLCPYFNWGVYFVVGDGGGGGKGFRILF